MSISKLTNKQRRSSIDAEAPEIMRTREAARYVCIPESTLAKLRMRANRERGPRFVKLSGTIIYRRSDLDAWIEENVVDLQ